MKIICLCPSCKTVPLIAHFGAKILPVCSHKCQGDMLTKHKNTCVVQTLYDRTDFGDKDMFDCDREECDAKLKEILKY